MRREFQPKKSPFLFRRIGGAVWLCLFLTLGATFAAVLSGMVLLWALVPLSWMFLFAPMAYSALVAYGKERYELHEDHLVCSRGSLLSDNRTELDVRNITHVRLRLPWLRHRFFKIGDVRVESAGSAASEITFESVTEPEKLFDEIKEIMRSNGYSLQGSQVLHEESPGTVGALTDAAQVGLGGGFTVFFILSIFAGVIVDAGLGGGLGQVVVMLVLALGAVVGVALCLGGPVIRYLDLVRRTYTVHEDMVVYTEGFLTRDNAVIPFENIADASATRTIWDQVLGLYDVRVSCQGSGSEIVFRRLSGGEQIKAAISELVANAGVKQRALEAKVAEAAASAIEEGGSEVAHAAPAARLVVPPDEAWTAVLKMNTARAVAGVTGALIVPPAWLLAAGMAAIRASKTEYRIGADTLSESYEFMGASHTQFAYDKVTGIQVSHTPFDGFFGTVSIEIWSIGAPKPLQMTHVMASDVDLPALLRQCGVPAQAAGGVVLPQSYGPKAALISQAFGLVGVALGLLGLLVASLFASPILLVFAPLLLVVPVFSYAWSFLRIRRQTFTLYPEHFEAQTGVWLRRHVYVRYADVKKVETVQIPMTDQGSLSLYVAGEKVMQTQNGEVKLPNIVKVQFLEGVERLVDALDRLSQGQLDAASVGGFDQPGEPALLESKPAIANELVVLALVGIFFPPLWLAIPIVAMQIRARSFFLEGSRVVRRDGVLFKRVTSVLYAKIDSIQQNQGALGKAFGNGQVTLLTAGSSTPDLTVSNVPDYSQVYDTIRSHYGSGKGGASAPGQLTDSGV